jgi:D-3-phosphoglycerate dehydrogenase
MPKNSFLINTSRGEIINEQELIEFLEKRPDIRFSADVITGEVNDLQMQNPLIPLHLEHRINLTPHIAGATYGSQTKAAVFAFEALIDHV